MIMKKIFLLLFAFGVAISVYSQNYPPATCKVTVTDNCFNREKTLVLIRVTPEGSLTSEDLFVNMGSNPSVDSVYGDAVITNNGFATFIEFYVPEGTYFLGYSNPSEYSTYWYFENYMYYTAAPHSGGELTRNYAINRDITITACYPVD